MVQNHLFIMSLKTCVFVMQKEIPVRVRFTPAYLEFRSRLLKFIFLAQYVGNIVFKIIPSELKNVFEHETFPNTFGRHETF